MRDVSEESLSQFFEKQFPIPFFEIASKEKSEQLSHANVVLGAQGNPLASGFRLPKISQQKTPTPTKIKSQVKKKEISEEEFSFTKRNIRKRREGRVLTKLSVKEESDDFLFSSEGELGEMTTEEKAICKKVVTHVMRHQHAWPFNQPVDPVALQIPDYFDVIKKPMDFRTISSKLRRNEYESLVEFEEDMSLVFRNAKTYNPPDHDVHKMADIISEFYQKIYHQQLEKTKVLQKKREAKRRKKETEELEETITEAHN